jgi:hypothetical protein
MANSFDITNFLNNNADQNTGLVAPTSPAADSTGLPFNRIINNRHGKTQRNIIHWFIPSFGVVNMYVNPQSIGYSDQKSITEKRTKNGYILQYWGNELGKLSIRGNTGAAGIEGVNVLKEIYNAEQLAFDSTGISMGANNQNAKYFGDITSQIGSSITQLGNANSPNVAGSIAQSLFGTSSNDFPSDDGPNLAKLAFSVEMYYSGWVFRGFFKSFSLTEDTNFLYTYDIQFVVTQRRGYRVNHLPFQRSAKDGPSGENVPYSFDGKVY